MEVTMIHKVFLYILSLWLLFLLIIVITFKIPNFCIDDQCTIAHTIKFIISENIVNIPILFSLIFLITGFIYYKKGFKFIIGGSSSMTVKIEKIEDINYEHLVFLTTYIIPLICFNLDNNRYLLTLLILLSVICVIYIKTDKFYANPTLAVLGYRIYKVDIKFINGNTQAGVVVITKDKLVLNDEFVYVRIDEAIFYGRKT